MTNLRVAEPRLVLRRRTGRLAVPSVRFDDLMYLTCCVTMCLFQFRDTTSGATRYYLEQFHLAGLWFVPDLLCLIPLIYFVRIAIIRNGSIFAWILFANFVAATAIGIAMMSSNVVATVSSVKLFLPLFCGFAFAGRSLTELPWMRWTIGLLMGLSVLGVLANTVIEFPWVGAEFDSFGFTKVAARLWWSQGEMRYGGFAGDSTAAAYLCMFPYFLIYRYLPKSMQVALWLPIGVAVWYTTSKTAILTGILFVIYYVATSLMRTSSRVEATGRLARLSFLLVLLPFVLILGLSGLDITAISPLLLSMEDRINNTWVFPFAYLLENFPAGIVTGCGLGCFNYPMNYTSMAHLNVPVDNFYLASYVMLGAPFLVLIAGMFVGTYKTRDPAKLLLILMGNIYSVTVQCYGPSATGVIMAYGFSDMFRTDVRSWRRRMFGNSVVDDGIGSAPEVAGAEKPLTLRIRRSRMSRGEVRASAGVAGERQTLP